MKKALLILILMFAIVPALAAGCDPTTVNNTYVTENHTDRQSFGYGVGADIALYKSANPLLSEIDTEYRWDIDNREHKVFVVGKVNLWDMFNN